MTTFQDGTFNLICIALIILFCGATWLAFTMGQQSAQNHLTGPTHPFRVTPGLTTMGWPTYVKAPELVAHPDGQWQVIIPAAEINHHFANAASYLEPIVIDFNLEDGHVRDHGLW